MGSDAAKAIVSRAAPQEAWMAARAEDGASPRWTKIKLRCGDAIVVWAIVETS
jgi:hypothetical protein